MHVTIGETSGVPSLYEVPCAACGKQIGAHAATWCRCVVRKITLTCPHCGTCLCKAPEGVQREFWRNAPAWLNDSQAAEQRRRVTAGRPGSAEAVDVLVVDDDEEIRMLAAYNIEQMGYSVAVARSGQDALLMLDRCSARVMITDALMPGLDGRELCQTVKTSHPEIKVVIMTALYKSPRYKYEAYRTFKADEYLPKPIDFNELHALVVRLIPHPMWKQS